MLIDEGFVACFRALLGPVGNTPDRGTERALVATDSRLFSSRIRADEGESALSGRAGELRRVVIASFVGTTIEWYDFFLYGTASALVFNRLFFPTLDPFAGTLSAYGAFAVGFVARPLGGAVFGHYGDRLGRKRVLVWSLAIMGAATALVGLLPTYDQIGAWAPACLFALRFFQGIGVGGEWGGAVLLAVEHSGADRRGLHGAWPQMGVPAGLLLATGVFSLFSSRLSEPAFLAWGWRMPFLVSVALIGVGLFIRLRILETPAFERVKQEQRESRTPLLDAFREHPREIAVGMGMRFAENAIFYIYTVFVLSYGEASLGYHRELLLRGVALASALGLFAIPLWAYVSDRVGRRPVYLAGALISLVLAFPFFWLLDQGPRFVGLALVLAVNVGHNMMYGPMAAYLSELFGAHVRYSGASVVYQLTSALSGGLSPFVATLLSAHYGWPAVAAYMAGCCAITATATWLAPETRCSALL